jgi:hypothetical protein
MPLSGASSPSATLARFRNRLYSDFSSRRIAQIAFFSQGDPKTCRYWAAFHFCVDFREFGGFPHSAPIPG